MTTATTQEKKTIVILASQISRLPVPTEYCPFDNLKRDKSCIHETRELESDVAYSCASSLTDWMRGRLAVLHR